MLIDSHCHLNFPDFKDEVPEIISRACAEGVRLMVTICTKLSEVADVISIAEENDSVFATVGIHPHEADGEPMPDVGRLIALAEHPKVVGIGETGLDYYYNHSSKAAQRANFRLHIQAARKTGLPLVVHTRDADEEMAAILKEEMEEGAFPGVLHCFSSGARLAKSAIELGLFISFSGILTFKNASELRDIARGVPRERLLVETDAPFLAPVPKRGKRNEPAFVAHTARCLAEQLGLTVAEVENLTTANFRRLFAKVPPQAYT